MSDFVLVHGGMHGAWCWQFLREELEKRGHRVATPEVPLHDPAAGMADFVAAVARAGKGMDRPVVVGHSLAGLIVPHVAGRIEVGGLVYLCSMIAPTTQAEADGNAALVNPDFWAGVVFDPSGMAACPPEAGVTAFFHDVDPELQAWALERLTVLAPVVYTETRFLPSLPAVPVAAIVTDEDFMVADAEGLKANMRARLGVEPIVLPGGHSPFLSHPAELAAVLVDFAADLDTPTPAG